MQLLLTLSYISLLLIPLLRKTELINQNLFALFLAFNYLIIITKCFNIIKKRDFLNKKSITLLCQINIFFLTLAFIFSLIFSPGNLQNIILDAFGSFLPIPIFLVFAFYDKDIINKKKYSRLLLLSTILISLSHLTILVFESFGFISFAEVHAIHGVNQSLLRSGGIFYMPIAIFPLFQFLIFREVNNKLIKLITFILFIFIILLSSISTSILFLYFLVFPILIIFWTESKLSKRKLKRIISGLAAIFLSLALIFATFQPARDFTSILFDVSSNRVVIKLYYRFITRPAMQMGIFDPITQKLGFSKDINLFPKFGYGVLLTNSNTYVDRIDSYKRSGEFVVQRNLLQWGYIVGFILLAFTRFIPVFLFCILIYNKKIELNPTKKIIYSFIVLSIMSGALDFRFVDYISCFGALIILLNSNLNLKSANKRQSD